jgi:hypothetical protein
VTGALPARVPLSASVAVAALAGAGDRSLHQSIRDVERDCFRVNQGAPLAGAAAGYAGVKAAVVAAVAAAREAAARAAEAAAVTWL